MRFKLHHIGIVVPNIPEQAKRFQLLGYNEITRAELDPIQKVLGCFITAKEGKDVYIELLEPTHGGSPITKFLEKRGGGLHHLCYEVDDIERVSKKLKKKGFQMVSPPVECVGYDRSFRRKCKNASKIAFFLTSAKMLIELLEKGQ